MKASTITIVLALASLAGGCTTVEMKQMGTETLRNAQGHVIGQKEVLCDCRNGERITRATLFSPRFDEQGTLVGYEEKIGRGDVVLRDLNGRRIGSRWIDVRSRANNPHTKGLTIIVYSQPAGTARIGATTMDELVSLAGLSPQL